MKSPVLAGLKMAPDAPTSGIRMKCAGCEGKEKLRMKPTDIGDVLQMKPEGGELITSDSLNNRLNGTKGSGEPLPEKVSGEMGAKIDADFSHVKIHTDSRAVQMSEEVGAQAFTRGSDIYFNKGRYSPESFVGKRLLAHELAHVVQQSAGGQASSMIQCEMLPDRNGSLVYTTRRGAENRMQNMIRVIPHPDREGSFVIEWRWDPTNPAEDPWTRGTRTYPSREAAEERVGQLMRIAGSDGRWYVEKDSELIPSGESESGSTEGDSTETETERETEGEPESEGEGSNKVCLTFDDGPKPATPGVLDELAAEGIPATFFLTGNNMARDTERQAALVRRMLAEGHRIANHVFEHSPTTSEEYERTYSTLIDPSVPDDPEQRQAFEENLTRNETHFRELLGSDFPGFDVARLPGQGRFYPELVAIVQSLGLPHVAWGFEFGNSSIGWLPARDWQSIAGVRATYTRLPSANDIILLHDAHWSGANQARFARILRKLKASGFTFGLINSSGNCT